MPVSPAFSRIRLAGEQDSAQLADLFDRYRQFYREPADLALAQRFIHERLRRADSILIVAHAEPAELIGFAQLYPTLCSVSAAPICILYDLYVAQQQRRRGIGRALLAEAARRAEQAGAIRVELATATDNVAAQKLYEALGWVRDNAFYRYSLPLR
jgi:ribosomal protein S18 acetylase RimI-like enzyme